MGRDSLTTFYKIIFQSPDSQSKLFNMISYIKMGLEINFIFFETFIIY